MIFKVTVLVIAAFVQANEVLSQGQQQQVPQYPQYGTQMWDPSSWTSPYAAASSNVWMDYIKKAAEVSQQLYKQWDKTGASNLMSAGMGFAQQWATEAQKAAEAAMKQAQAANLGMFN